METFILIIMGVVLVRGIGRMFGSRSNTEVKYIIVEAEPVNQAGNWSRNIFLFVALLIVLDILFTHSP